MLGLLRRLLRRGTSAISPDQLSKNATVTFFFYPTVNLQTRSMKKELRVEVRMMDRKEELFGSCRQCTAMSC